MPCFTFTSKILQPHSPPLSVLLAGHMLCMHLAGKKWMQPSTTPHLRQCESFSLAVNHHLTRGALYLLLDEPQQVFLVHARGGVNVGVYL